MKLERINMAKVDLWAVEVATQIIRTRPTSGMLVLHAVPRGGYVPAYNLLSVLRARSVECCIGALCEAHYIIDDIVDSGETRRKYQAMAPQATFIAVVDKGVSSLPPWPRVKTDADAWIVFPWEQAEGKEETVEDNVRRMLQFIGEDPNREGLKETPARVAKAYGEWFSGYGVEDPASILKVFEDGAEGVDEMVVVKDIRFYSHCEHHLAPFFGTVTIAYVPNGKIVGLSKFHRLVEIFARRLQVQERLTKQIADVLETALAPKGVAVLVTARHLCVESRGAKHVNSETVTNALRGVFKTSAEARAEFLKLAK